MLFFSSENVFAMQFAKPLQFLQLLQGLIETSIIHGEAKKDKYLKCFF